MKGKRSYGLGLALIAALLMIPKVQSMAAEVVVEPGFQTLQIAVADHPGSTFILKKGGVYVIDQVIVIDVATLFLNDGGGTDLAPPVLQYHANPGEAGNNGMFLLGADVTFDGIGFQGHTPHEEQLRKPILTCTANNIAVTIDGCIFQAVKHPLEFGGKNNNTFFMVNRWFNAGGMSGASIAEFIWPLPFNFKPGNREVWHLGSDGYPVGDLNWFGEELVSAWEAGKPNPLHALSASGLGIGEMKLKCYPNPFSNTTLISYSLPTGGQVSVTLYNLSGSQVAQVVNGYQREGAHEVAFDGSGLSSGLYICKVQWGLLTQIEKLSLAR